MVQEAYLKLWNKRDELAGVLNTEAYCVTLVKNLCNDALRRSRPDEDGHAPCLLYTSRGITNCKSHLPKEKSSCHRLALSDAGVFLETDSRMAMGEAACAEMCIRDRPQIS